ncbi:response regulator [Methylocaldum sp.]|uniref:response regulator n=1 Tax=Methylocaldum sp. TaxID=1969727 RepID=UPI002D5BF046|nr:response regulator [Methylocaldum sp.]HYE37851.1 response regulator [Methylocaldum sp.]
MPARILVIEDNPDNMDLMVYLLEAYGHIPLTAHDGEAGVEIALRELPDLVICDIHLPKLDGYGVIRELRRRAGLGQTPVVAVTALAMAGDRENLLAAGFDGYISKPIVPESFVEHVESFLRDDLRSIRKHEPALTAPEPVATPEARRGAILVVDDSSDNRELIRSIVEPFGYGVTLAESVKQALTHITRIRFDLILSDLDMPDMDGWSFLEAVRADVRLRATPLVFISASVQGTTERDLALRQGAAGFILSPIEPQALLREIERCLNGARHGEDSDR